MRVRDEAHRSWLAILLWAAIVLLAFTAAPQRAKADPAIAAAGDIACDNAKPNANSCHQAAVSDLIVGGGYAGVLALGDIQYEKGALDAFLGNYDPTWGRFKSITHPAPGNHEYGTKAAAGYFAYFGAAAGPPGRGYYSYDIGSWHLISLNSNCGIVSCAAGSPQETWLKADLAAHPTSCTLAYWHHPRFSSGGHGSSDSTGPLFTTLYNAGAEIVLVGHDHHYERFGPQSPAAAADPVYGIREFVVGTGGRSHSGTRGVEPNSQVRNSDTFGVLALTLHPASYDWRFIPEAGKTFSDAGSAPCHGSKTGPLLKLFKPERARFSRRGTVQVRALCATVCTVKARATIRFGRGKVGSLRLRRTLSPEGQVKLRIKFASSKARALRRRLARRKRLRAKVTVTATNTAGQASTRRLTLRLRR